jgi:hypothetical protein
MKTHAAFRGCDPPDAWLNRAGTRRSFFADNDNLTEEMA